ncbi:MAG: DUF4238 domain-containing protein [Candidatus Eisenbacteria sp.]|nr:DUF4238 domain-containing protein [Candidatus Eisenbacteria bacterium]
MNHTAAFAWSMMFVETLLPVLLSLRWSMCDAPSGYHFLTCDSPVVSFAPTSRGRAQFGAGFVNPRLEVTFPISPSVCLFLHRKGRQNRWRCSRRLVSEINRRTAAMAHEYIFSGVNSRRIARLVRDYAVPNTESWVNQEAVRMIARRSYHMVRRLKEDIRVIQSGFPRRAHGPKQRGPDQDLQPFP